MRHALDAGNSIDGRSVIVAVVRLEGARKMKSESRMLTVPTGSGQSASRRLRWAASAQAMAPPGVENTAKYPSPLSFTIEPPLAAIARCSRSLWSTDADLATTTGPSPHLTDSAPAAESTGSSEAPPGLGYQRTPCPCPRVPLWW